MLNHVEVCKVPADDGLESGNRQETAYPDVPLLKGNQIESIFVCW